jgi:hypothetical protein
MNQGRIEKHLETKMARPPRHFFRPVVRGDNNTQALTIADPHGEEALLRRLEP